MVQGGCEPKYIAGAFAYLIEQANPIPSNELESTLGERDERRSDSSRKRRQPSRSRSRTQKPSKPFNKTSGKRRAPKGAPSKGAPAKKRARRK